MVSLTSRDLLELLKKEDPLTTPYEIHQFLEKLVQRMIEIEDYIADIDSQSEE